MKLARMPDGSPEIFHTLQGEGRNTGRPSVFIRSSLCNLHCQWCDTPYTWNWEGSGHSHESADTFLREEQIITLSVEEIARAVSAFDCSNFVFTGGEPLLQEKEWLELMRSLSGEFEIETNGTLLPGDEFLDKIDQINVSPKLNNSGVADDLRIKPDVLRSLSGSRKADFKFVIGSLDDFAEVRTLIDQCGISSDHVFLMPKANSISELEENQSAVARLALENGFHYSDRLHLRIFGTRRGV